MGNRPLAFALLAVLCFAAYAPMLSLPLFEDDYPLIALADNYGFTGVLTDPVFRPRATLSWTMLALWRTFHLTPTVYHTASLAVHIANTWLVYLLFLWWPMPAIRRAAFWAAAFFAIAEGHQEAVVWFAAMSELLQFLFGAAALYCYLRAQQCRRAPLILALGSISFALALLSKESAVIWLPFFALATPPGRWRKALPQAIPFLALGLFAVVAFALTAGQLSFRFTDGSFSLHAPFIATWIRNVGRVLWIWGVAALAVIVTYRRDTELLRAAAIGLLWIGIGLVPYCFLTYSSQIPSRQTYLASAGLTLLFGLAFDRMARVPARRKLVAVLAMMVIAHNVGILWFRKRAQFRQRAEPTEQLIRLARQTSAPIWVRCFPRPGLIASEAVHLAAGRLPSDVLFTEAEASARPPAAEFCYPNTSR